MDPAGSFIVDRLVAEASVAAYVAFVFPGDTVNPDKLPGDQDAVAVDRGFVESRKKVAAICHRPWTLIKAGVVTGRPPDVLPEDPHGSAHRRDRSR